MKRIVQTAAMVVALATGTASAQDFPSKPINLIIPYAAGGSTETMARIFSKAFGDELGQKVLVQVRPGAGGAIGATEIAKAEPDGYTIAFTTASSLLWPPLTQDVEYTADSFAFVAKITDYQQAIVAKADAPFNTLEELIAASREGTLSYGDQSTLSRAFIDAIGDKEGVEWNGIPTKGGGEMVPFLLGGKIDFAWSGGVHSRYGDQIKVLLSMNEGRLAANPDIPSISEGYGISMPSQAVLIAPAGTPRDVVDTLAEAAKKAMENAEFVDLMNNNLLFPLSYAGPDEIKAAVDASAAQLKAIAEGM